jgi:hypothetical protein
MDSYNRKKNFQYKTKENHKFWVVYGHLFVGQLPAGQMLAGHLLVQHVFAINNSVGEGESAWQSVMMRV